MSMSKKTGAARLSGAAESSSFEPPPSCSRGSSSTCCAARTLTSSRFQSSVEREPFHPTTDLLQRCFRALPTATLTRSCRERKALRNQ